MSEPLDFPSISPYKRHVIMCCGKSCGENLPLMKYLKKRLVIEGLDKGENAVRANRGGCLGVCEQGPIMVVHPEGVWYCNLNETKMDRIIDEHFKLGKAVADYAFHMNHKDTEIQS